MKENVSLLLDIARKSFEGANFRQAISYAAQAKAGAEGRAWLEAQRYLLLSWREMARPEEILVIRAELLEFVKDCPDPLKALAYYLISQQYAYANEWPKAKGSIAQAMDAALKNENVTDLAYALFGSAAIHLYQGDFERTRQDMRKLETILAQHPRDEIRISLCFLKVNLEKDTRNLDQALKELWTAYELAREKSFHVYVPTILSFMSNIYFEKKSYQEAKFYLNLAIKGVSAENQPMLLGYLARQMERLEKVLPKEDFDLIVDIQNRLIHEKNKGTVDFKNQHTLLELALLFFKNPQSSFKKEELIRKVWGQEYAPGPHDNLIYVTIKRLRSLIEPDPDHPRYILRNRQGYYFNNSNKLQFKTGDST